MVLKSDDFLGLVTDSAALARAESLLSLVNGAATVLDGTHRAVSIDGIQYTGPDGNTITHKFLTAMIKGRSRLSIDVTGTATDQPSEIARWVAYADTDPRGRRIFRYLLNRGDWVSLYKVLEEIEEDMGGRRAIRNTGWATLKTLSLFTSTANNRLAIGDAARHSHGRFHPPARPLSLEQADSLIRTIASSWFRRHSA